MRKRVDLQNKLVTYTVFGLYYLGLILGAVYAAGHRGEQNNYFWYYIESFLQNHNAGSFLPVFSVSFLSVLGLNLLLLICSFSCLGAPFILMLPLLRGISAGMVSAVLYLSYGLKGLLFELFLLLLPTVVQALELLLFAADTFDTSVKLFRCALLHRSSVALIDPRKALQGFVLYSSAGLAAAILEGFFALLLGPVFRF